MKIIERSTGKTVAEIVTNHSWTLDEALEWIGANVDRETLDVEYNGEVYDLEDLDIQ